MNEKNNNDTSNPEEIQIAYSLKLALVGGLLATLGDAISTYAGSLAIDEYVQEARDTTEKDRQLEERLAAIERKLDSFQNKME
ncbi:hypothetical protein MKY30_10620 [Oceanobacillus sp. FSL W8-0428]|uniref:Uncharacterized protein n=1 Tax=Oceanobacillus sojae TaxID=582851 RepID=A0A511ZKC9_9BACI|nr:hypothetical protein [Oceanobacillus sojae]GEN87840.1 hypothetical protein OSO01_25790 [Oceanobacillus sojae]